MKYKIFSVIAMSVLLLTTTGCPGGQITGGSEEVTPPTIDEASQQKLLEGIEGNLPVPKTESGSVVKSEEVIKDTVCAPREYQSIIDKEQRSLFKCPFESLLLGSAFKAIESKVDIMAKADVPSILESPLKEIAEFKDFIAKLGTEKIFPVGVDKLENITYACKPKIPAVSDLNPAKFCDEFAFLVKMPLPEGFSLKKHFESNILKGDQDPIPEEQPNGSLKIAVGDTANNQFVFAVQILNRYVIVGTEKVINKIIELSKGDFSLITECPLKDLWPTTPETMVKIGGDIKAFIPDSLVQFTKTKRLEAAKAILSVNFSTDQALLVFKAFSKEDVLARPVSQVMLEIDVGEIDLEKLMVTLRESFAGSGQTTQTSQETSSNQTGLTTYNVIQMAEPSENMANTLAPTETQIQETINTTIQAMPSTTPTFTTTPPAEESPAP